ncbi:MAG: YicC family protein [Eubacteriales bacterium]|nr:YicC family protein [Eubacteriales bacterium]
MLSMTGFGRGHANRDGRDLLLEMKAVNHRFLDPSFRLPKALSFLEEPLRVRLNESVKRGHVELTLTYRNGRPDASVVSIDTPLVMQCAVETQAIADALHKPPPTVAELVSLCGALSVTQADDDTDAITALALEAYDEAFAQLEAMREREGAALATDMEANLSQIEALMEDIAQRAPCVPLNYRERLQVRMSEWNVQPAEPQRIAQEIALLTDKCAIDEELSRLKSHFTQFSACLCMPDEVGRRMDFLLQEMNRETNTVGSKANDAPIAQTVVEIKCLLEKLREQVQNIV